MWKVWLAMLAVGCSVPAGFLSAVDDSLQLRLFLNAMSHGELPWYSAASCAARIPPHKDAQTALKTENQV